MKKIILSLALGAMVASPILTAASISQAAVAGRGSITKINGEGFRKCKAFDKSGAQAWTANAKGRLEEDSGGFLDIFNIKTCFATKSECSRFIDRIHHHVLGIEELRYARCTERG